MTIILIGANGKKLHRQAITATVLGAGDRAIAVRFTDVKKVDYVVSFNFDTMPPTSAIKYGTHSISGNVVGVTVTLGAGTTLRGDVIGVA